MTTKKAAPATAKPIKKKAGSPRTSQDKKDLAKILYTQNNFSRKDVAERVGLNEKTVGGWVRDEGWDNMRKSLLVSRKELMSSLLDQLSEITEHIKQKPKGQRYADSKEADTQGKIAAAIKQLTTDTGLNEIIEVCGLAISFASTNFPEIMKVLTPVLDAFVKQYL